ncbi:MAG: ribosome maturation factor RimP, partial [Candidatus Hydrogenedentes bacterium]|nr:ribosome maturation factor RimP [Candidatus Hydrogenedentota bacterium]
MEREEIVRSTWSLIEPHLAEQGYEVVELEYTRQGGTRVLRVFIDKDGGITLDDCAAVSQLLSPILDEADLIAESYMLEVSSPGIDRPLRKPADFDRFAGEEIRLQTYSPLEGRSRFKGVLKGIQGDLIVLDCDGRTFEIHLENLK